MSQLPTSGPTSTFRNAGEQSRRLNTPRLTQGPQVEPLIAPAPRVVPDTRRVSRLQSLAQALGVGAQLGTSIANTIEVRSNAEAGVVRGRGALDAEEDLPGLIAGIESGEIAVPEDMETGEFLNGLIAANTKDMPKPYRDGYRGRAGLSLARALGNAQVAKIEQAKQQTATTGLAAMLSAQTPEAVSDAIAMSDTDLSRAEIIDRMILPALEASVNRAAVDGPLAEQAFEQIASSLGDGEAPVEVAALRRSLEIARNTFAENQDGRARELVMAPLNDARSGQGSEFASTRVNEAQENLNQLRQAGLVSEAEAGRLQSRINTHISARNTNGLKLERQHIETQARKIVSAALEVPGGIAALGNTIIETELSNGTVVKVATDSVLREVLDEQYLVRQREYQNDPTPYAAERDMAQLLATHGSNAKMPQWTGTMEAGIEVFQGWDGRGDLPQVVKDGYGLYAALKDTNPAVVDRHLPPSSPIRQLYDTVYRELQLVGEGDLRTAMARALDAHNNPPVPRSTPTEMLATVTDLLQNLDGPFLWSLALSRNRSGGDLNFRVPGIFDADDRDRFLSELTERALLIEGGNSNITQEQAAIEAMDELIGEGPNKKVMVINGHITRLGQHELPPSMGASEMSTLSSFIVAEYLKRNGALFDPDEKLHLGPDPNQANTWTLLDETGLRADVLAIKTSELPILYALARDPDALKPNFAIGQGTLLIGSIGGRYFTGPQASIRAIIDHDHEASVILDRLFPDRRND